MSTEEPIIRLTLIMKTSLPQNQVALVAAPKLYKDG